MTTNAQLDLSRLAVDRSPPAGAPRSAQRRPRKWVSRYLFPIALLFGFATLMAIAAGIQLFPRQAVEIVPVIVKRTTSQSSGTPLFRAAGWIEPRPTSINVPALAPGVIEALLVVEGQAVKQGDPIARLIAIDAEIATQQAEAELANAEGELNRALAEQRAAKIRLETPIHLQVQLADAEAELAKSETALSKLPYLIESAKAGLEYAQQSVVGKRAAGEAVPGVVLQKAQSELASADATLRELQQRQPNLVLETKSLRAKVAALKSQLQLLVEERRQLEEAAAKVESAIALRDMAKLRLQKSELVLDRNTIRAPIDGRILRLIASPGMRVTGMDGNAGHSSSTVVEMYDPKQLQVRADVRLEDVPLVQPGQPVEIETASSENTIQGRVLQANSTANIQKNTLEVKVEILEPPESIRPEMLVTAVFLAPEVAGAANEATETERLFVPQQLLISGASETSVWIVDAKQRARRRVITTGSVTPDELVEVLEGLSATDKLIASDSGNLEDGSSVKITGEHRSLGR